MLNFGSMKKQDLPKRISPNSLTLQQLFEKKKDFLRKSRRKFGRFSFVTIEFENKLYLFDGLGHIKGMFDNPESVETMRDARLIYVEEIKNHKNTEGGCYFN